MPRKLNYLPIALFAFIMAYVLAVSSYMLKYFPLRSAGDMAIHIANVFFLDQYGFHKIVPNWYNGFQLFELYSPGWSYLGLFIYKLTGNYLIMTYAALIITYAIGFLGIYLICKNQNISKSNTLFFFLAFFFNYILAVYAIRTGRFPELLAWSIFTLFFFAIIYCKDRTFTWKAVFIPVIYALLMLTHIYVFVVASTLLASILLVKSNKERLTLVLLVLLTLVITSFWWIPFFNASQQVKDGAAEYGAGLELLDASTLISTNTAIGLLFIAIFIFYARENRKAIAFYLPMLVLDILLLSRLIYFVPILRSVPTTPYNVFFAFISLFMIFKLQNSNAKKVAFIGLIIFAVFSAAYTLRIDLDYKYSSTDKEFFDVLAHVEHSYLMLDETPDVHHEKMAAYAATYHNLSTPIGYFREYESLKYVMANGKEVLLKEALNSIRNDFKNKDCKFLHGLNELNVDEIIVKREYCSFVRSCDLKEKYSTSSLCLFRVLHN